MVEISFLRFLDKSLLIFLLLLYPFRFLTKKTSKSTSKKVLIIRLWGIGDSICTLPLVKKLSDKGYSVSILTTKNVYLVYNKQKFIKKIFHFNYKKPLEFFSLISSLNKENFEIIIDTEQFMNISTLLLFFINSSQKIGYNHLFRSNFYTKKIKYVEEEHFVKNFMKLLGSLTSSSLPKNLVPLTYGKNSIKKVDNLLLKYKNHKIIALHMGSGGTALGRRWDKNNFLTLANTLAKIYPNVVLIFTGLDEEKNIYNEISKDLALKTEINLINALSLSDFFYLLTNIDVFISNDTGPMHIAAAQGTKVIGLFGLNHPNKVGPWPIDKNISLYLNPNNTPIINNKYSIYPKNALSTINLIKVSDVLTAVRKFIK